ncbi:MAG: hypothetical protein FWF85_01320 [Clostridiales bacterium]|nr:hypothetical protein [Clostridiales bacterium]
MRTTSKLWLVYHLFFLVIFNIVFFIARGIPSPLSVWISYLAIHLAYLLSWLLPRLRLPTLAMFSLYKVISLRLYFWLEFITGIIFIIAQPDNWRLALIVQLLLFFIFGLWTILLLTGGVYAKEGEPLLEEARQKAKQTDYISMAKTKLAVLLRATLDLDLKREIMEISAALEKSPQTSKANSGLTLDLISQLTTAVSGKNRDAIAKAKAELLDLLQE